MGDVKLTDDETALLRRIVDDADISRTCRPGQSPERDRLKRQGLIFSRRMRIQSHAAGKTSQWLPTEAGRRALQGDPNDR